MGEPPRCAIYRINRIMSEHLYSACASECSKITEALLVPPFQSLRSLSGQPFPDLKREPLRKPIFLIKNSTAKGGTLPP